MRWSFRYCRWVMVLTVLTLVAWKSYPYFVSAENARKQEIGKALFARPSEVSERSGGFSIRIDGKDALRDAISVRSNVAVEVEATLPPVPPKQHQMLEMLVLPVIGGESEVDRPVATEEKGTSVWFNYDRRPDVPDLHMEHPAPQQIAFPCPPGEYVVRFFLRRIPVDFETGMPENLLLGEADLTVLASAGK